MTEDVAGNRRNTDHRLRFAAVFLGTGHYGSFHLPESMSLDSTAGCRRAGVRLDHFEAVMAEHQRIEARNAAGNPPEVVERLERNTRRFREFPATAWADRCERFNGFRSARSEKGATTQAAFPTFREWLASQESSGLETS